MGGAGVWTDEFVAEVQRLWSAGLGGTEIAKKLGVTRNTIIGKITRMKWERGPPPPRVKKPKPERRLRVPSADPKVKPPSFPVETVPVTATATIFELPRRGRCKWPIGDPGKDGFGYCGRDTDIALSYCTAHNAAGHAPRASSTPTELMRSVRRYL